MKINNELQHARQMNIYQTSRWCANPICDSYNLMILQLRKPKLDTKRKVSLFLIQNMHLLERIKKSIRLF